MRWLMTFALAVACMPTQELTRLVTGPDYREAPAV